jgi:hypothetical protein
MLVGSCCSRRSNGRLTAKHLPVKNSVGEVATAEVVVVVVDEATVTRYLIRAKVRKKEAVPMGHPKNVAFVVTNWVILPESADLRRRCARPTWRRRRNLC